VALGFSDSALLVDADAHEIRIPSEPGGSIEGERYVREQERHRARPGNLITWAVDRTRAMPWFGSDRMQLVKAIAFMGLDWIERAVGTVTGDDGSERVAEELGDLVGRTPVEYTDPETGWPLRRWSRCFRRRSKAKASGARSMTIRSFRKIRMRRRRS
jgi:hypothetical protein